MVDVVAIATVAAAVVGLIAQTWETGKGIADNIKGEGVNAKLRDLTNKLANAMKQNDRFREEIMAAYNTKSSTRLQNLISANPVGASFNAAQKAIAQADKEYKDAMVKTSKRAADLNKANNQISSLAQSGQTFWNADSAKEGMDAAYQAVNGGLKENG